MRWQCHCDQALAGTDRHHFSGSVQQSAHKDHRTHLTVSARLSERQHREASSLKVRSTTRSPLALVLTRSWRTWMVSASMWLVAADPRMPAVLLAMMGAPPLSAARSPPRAYNQALGDHAGKSAPASCDLSRLTTPLPGYQYGTGTKYQVGSCHAWCCNHHRVSGDNNRFQATTVSQFQATTLPVVYVRTYVRTRVRTQLSIYGHT